MQESIKTKKPNTDYRGLYGATAGEIALRFNVKYQYITYLHNDGRLAVALKAGKLPERRLYRCKFRKKYGLSGAAIAKNSGMRESEVCTLEKFGVLGQVLKEKEIKEKS